MEELVQDTTRLTLQACLNAQKNQAERNRLGQFATPTGLAREVLAFGIDLLGSTRPIHFLDPALGLGAFFSALLYTVPRDHIQTAKGFEIDPHYGEPARQLWQDTLLDIELGDFTRAPAPQQEAERFNLIICNPPYVRHHHIPSSEKLRLQDATTTVFGARIAGLAGLYCYFLGLCHAWMQQGGVGGWLIPSEFMDVNYGEAVKRYLLHQVTLLRIHRFDPNDVQFDDALVSSAVVWFRNELPPPNNSVEFTFGGTLLAPRLMRRVTAIALSKEPKWTRFPVSDIREANARYRLSDLFTIKRGIATGDNKFFILTREQIAAHRLPPEVCRPILPSPRYVPTNEITADQDGTPRLERQLFLLDCRLPEAEVQERYPQLWAYLEQGKDNVADGYLCRSRKVWYFQEERPSAPLLCSYLGRGDAKNGHPFRFFLNHSCATAPNVYLLLYPKTVLTRALARDTTLLKRMWEFLNNLDADALLGEGRVYGGGLHKLEPKELGNVDATAISEQIPELTEQALAVQLSLFS